MKPTKANAAEVLKGLSPDGKKLLLTIGNSGKHKIDFWMLQAFLELLAKKIIRADINLLTGGYIVVIERGGQHVLELLRKEK